MTGVEAPMFVSARFDVWKDKDIEVVDAPNRTVTAYLPETIFPE